MQVIRRLVASCVGMAALGSGSVAAELLPGPYPAAVEHVVDGDTIGARVAIWLNQDLSVLVRIRGIDAPELRGRCGAERTEAREAALALQTIVAGGAIMLSRIEGDKYFGRVIADVATPSGADIGAALIAGGHARAYDGGTRRSWCGEGVTGRAGEPSTLARIAPRHWASETVPDAAVPLSPPADPAPPPVSVTGD